MSRRAVVGTLLLKAFMFAARTRVGRRLHPAIIGPCVLCIVVITVLVDSVPREWAGERHLGAIGALTVMAGIVLLGLLHVVDRIHEGDEPVRGDERARHREDPW